MFNSIVKLAQVSFQKGTALVKGQKLNGTIKHIAKNGDHMEMRYLDGVIQDVKRVGKKSYIKEYTSNGVYTYGGDKLTLNANAKGLDIRGKVGGITSILDKSMPNTVLRKDGAGNILGGHIKYDGIAIKENHDVMLLKGGDFSDRPVFEMLNIRDGEIKQYCSPDVCPKSVTDVKSWIREKIAMYQKYI